MLQFKNLSTLNIEILSLNARRQVQKSFSIQGPINGHEPIQPIASILIVNLPYLPYATYPLMPPRLGLACLSQSDIRTAIMLKSSSIFSLMLETLCREEASMHLLEEHEALVHGSFERFHCRSWRFILDQRCLNIEGGEKPTAVRRIPRAAWSKF